MNDQNDIFILDNDDRKALEARLMELSDLFWDLFERKRLAAIRPESKSVLTSTMTKKSPNKRVYPLY